MNLSEAIRGTGGDGDGAQRIYGVVSAIVSDNHDPEGRARVKIQFPWLAGDTDTEWAKLATLMAGKNRGSCFIPEVGDEVLVAFEHGDLHHPYILGAMWNSEDPPCETNSDGRNNIRKIRSRSGHELVFCDDAQGKQERVEIKTNGGHRIVLSDAAGAEKVEIQDKTGSNLVVIDSVKGEIRIESQLTLKLKSKQVEIEAELGMKLTAGAVLELKGALVKIN